MSSEFGTLIHVTIFGESHGEAVGAVIDGLPAGEHIDMAELDAFLARRKPGCGSLTSARKEADRPIFLSGILNDTTEGTPLCVVIKNEGHQPSDYDEIKHLPRPGHADLTAFAKYSGFADMRGGGHFSGRLTAPLCVAGGIAKQILARRGIHVGAHLASVGSVCDRLFPLHPDKALFDATAQKPIPVIDDEAGELMRSEIEAAAADGDSVGGVIEIAMVGLPAGLGSPSFGGLESRLAQAFFGIPAVKGVEFGDGFIGAASRASDFNDPFVVRDGQILTSTNRCGGILGGISTGMPLIARLAVKPTPSIAQPQRTVNLGTFAETTINVNGRHDPCIALRAVPAAEAAAALVLLDIIREGIPYED